MEFEILEITALYAVLIPGAVSGLALLFFPQRLAPLAMAFGFLVGYIGIQGWPQFLPNESTQWFPWIVISMAFLCLAYKLENKIAWWVWLVTSLTLYVYFYLLLLPAFEYSWELLEGLIWLSVWVAATLLFYAGLRFKSDQEHPSIPPAVFLIVAGSMAIILGISGSVIMSQLAAVQASIIGAALIVILWRRKSVLESSELLHLVLFSGLVVSGWYFVEVNIPSLIILIMVPWLVKLISNRIPESWPLWAHLLTIIAVSLVTASFACYIAVISSPPLVEEFY